MHPPEEEVSQPLRVLAIDDDLYILSQIHHILGQNGYEVLTATGSQAGLNLFCRDVPDLVLLEFELADLGGQDLLGQMKERRPHVPVIVLASASEMAAVASLRRGADDYLSKPLAPEELLERVRHNLDKGREARAQAELNEQLQRQLAMLVSMRELAREASAMADLYALLSRVLDQTLRNMRLDAGIVFSSEGDDLFPLIHRGLPQSIASSLTRRRLNWGEPSLRSLQRSRQAVRTRSEEQRGGPLSQAVGYRFTAVVPLWAQGRCWGLLEVAGREERHDPAQDLEMLTTVGQQMAIALASDRLQETAVLRVRELAFLNEACLALTSDLDLEHILTTIMLRTSDVIGVEMGSLLLVDEEKGDLVFRISLGRNADRVLSRRIPPGQGIAGWVFQHGQSLLVPDVRKDPRYYPKIDEYTGFRTRSILSVPLKSRDEVLGVIELANKIVGEFTDDDRRLLESVAALTTTAIEQSRLHEWTTSFVLVDPLTRLPNHNFFAQALEREAARCRRYGRTCGLLLLGVDRRLQLPEPRWRELTAAVRKTLRQSDLLCRHRDGPFIVLLPETGAEGARTLSGRLEEQVRRAGIKEPQGGNLADFVRFGVAAFPEDVEDPKDLLERAERALTEAWQEQARAGL